MAELAERLFVYPFEIANIPVALSSAVLSFGHTFARGPFAIEPPETEETVSSFDRRPTSLRRRKALRWKSAARYPPPERQSALPLRSSFFSGWYFEGATNLLPLFGRANSNPKP
ncbi:MAG TPA: hypothetical protein VKM54_20675 [Myxococcota bacterium]|nr:hypothetical protein [Myxococcota bacterium]